MPLDEYDNYCNSWPAYADIIQPIGTIPYIAADGTKAFCAEFTELTGSEDELGEGWYVVNSDITYTSGITFTGDVHIILADGKTMNVGTDESRISDGNGIICYDKANDTYYDLTICGQSLGTGTLSIYVSGDYYNAIVPHNITINGGNVITHTDGKNSKGIDAKRLGDITINGGSVTATTTDTGDFAWAINARGNLTINGGNVSAKSNSIAILADGNLAINGGTISATGGSGSGINCNGTITLGWNKPTDRISITASSYYGNVSVASGQKLTDGTNIYTDATESATLKALTNTTLYPYIENLSLAANPHDGNYWTTFYCGHTGYKIDDGENAWAYTATVSGNELTLHKLGKVIPKQTAVILVGSDNEISMTASTDPAENTVSNDLQGEDVRTLKSTLGDGTFYVMGKVNDVFGFYQYTAQYMPARKAYLLVSGSAAPGLKMVFDETSSLNEELRIKNEEFAPATGWYTLSGTRLNAQPTQKGVYIHGNKKIVIK